MKTIRFIILAAAAAVGAQAGEVCNIPTPCTVAARVVHAWPGCAPRDIRAIPLFPFSPSPAIVYVPTYQPAAVVAALPPPPEPTITVTITVPVSVARELVKSGAIRLPTPAK